MDNSMIETGHILVHPDCHVDPTWGLMPDQRQFDLRKGWDQQVTDLAKVENSVLFYFPAISTRIDILHPTTRVEVDRQNRYRELLGERFICFEPYFKPTPQYINWLMVEMGFNYQPENLQLVAYGQFLENCVDTLLGIVGDGLSVPAQSRVRLKNLSLGEQNFSLPIIYKTTSFTRV